MRRLGLVLCTFISLAVFAARPAAAQSVTISGEGVFTEPYFIFPGFSPGTASFLFTIPMSPVPSFSSPGAGYWDLRNVTGHFTQGVMSMDILGALSFGPGLSGPEFAFDIYFYPVPIAFDSSQLWSGTAAAPTMLLGHYSGYSPDYPTSPWLNVTELDITSTVPEPATLTLLATGLVGLAASRRKRKRPTA